MRQNWAKLSNVVAFADGLLQIWYRGKSIFSSNTFYFEFESSCWRKQDNQVLEVLPFCNRESAEPPSLKITVLTFLVKNGQLKLSGKSIFWEYVKKRLSQISYSWSSSSSNLKVSSFVIINKLKASIRAFMVVFFSSSIKHVFQENSTWMNVHLVLLSFKAEAGQRTQEYSFLEFFSPKFSTVSKETNEGILPACDAYCFWLMCSS